MHHPQPGPADRAAHHLAIAASGIVCALTRRAQPMLRCASCAYFQGMLVGPELSVLCAAPRRGPARSSPGRPSLVFPHDLPVD